MFRRNRGGSGRFDPNNNIIMSVEEIERMEEQAEIMEWNRQERQEQERVDRMLRVERTPEEEDEEKAEELMTSGLFLNDLAFEDIDDDFFDGPRTERTSNVSKTKTTLGLLSLAGLGIGAGLAIKRKFTKKKPITKRDILLDVLNNKPIEELQSLVVSSDNKSKDELIKEIVNKMI